MNKKVIFFIALGMACIMAVQAGGKRDVSSYEADSPDGFTSSIPIEDKKVGKWNFFIEATDKGGNTTIAGPHNIYHDPVSDLPVTTIINPKVNMHVQGNLNIVGICADDDGVAQVEFVVTRGPDGKGEELVRTRAEGTEFWSYLLDTTDQDIWTDGVYTITAWGTDINGLSGISDDFPAKVHKKHQVMWNLDRKKPVTRVSSHETGALVTGKINLKGTVVDGNGVRMLRYSLDNGTSYRPLPIKYNKLRDVYDWNLNLDTRLFEDGPAVLWFQSWDGMGTQGLAAHLLFVNNTKPEVQIIYPEPEQTVGGVFTVASYAVHPVGLKSVTWKLGKETGEFPMVIGNSWWIQEFDIRDQKKAATLDLEIKAEDLSGNTTVSKRKLRVNPNAGVMRVTLDTPTANATLSGDELNIKGTVSGSENDVLAAILYSINSGPAVELPATAGYFQFAIPEIEGGTYTLDVWAKDILGVEGPKTQVRGIFAPGPLPEPRIATVRSGTGRTMATENFFTGMDLIPDSRLSLDIEVASAVPITAASITFEGKVPTPLTVRAGRDNIYRAAEVPVPTDLTAGLRRVELRATDRLGRESVWEEYVNIAGALTSDVQWVRAKTVSDTDARILLNSPEDILLGLAGQGFQNATLNGTGSENFVVTVNRNGLVELSALSEGNFGPFTLNLDGSRNVYSNSFSILADFSPPLIGLPENPDGSWVQNEVELKYTLADANRIVAMEYSLDLGDSWGDLLSTSDLANFNPAAVFEHSMDISSFADGAITIALRATDEANNVAVEYFTVFKDTVPPEPQLIVPLSDARVNGAIRLGFSVLEAGSLKSVTYYHPGSDDVAEITQEVYSSSALELDYPPRFFDILMDPFQMPLDEAMVFIFEDEAGNIAELTGWTFIIDNEMDIPIIHITLPLEDEVIITDFEVSGVMFDDDAIRQVHWYIDDGEMNTVIAENGFSIPIALAGLTDNEHTVTVIAEDIYGVRSEPVTRNFRVSLREPVASVTAPAFDILAGGYVEMSGGAFDENGIAAVQISLDNGNTFNDTRINAYDNTAEWFYEFQSSILADGPNVIFVKVFDNYGISAIYSSLLNVDNTPPEITLDYPLDGSITTSTINILGEVVDINLEEKVIELRSLEGLTMPPGFKVYRVGQSPFLKETFDMSALPDGSYNVEIQAVDKAGNVSSVSRNIELSRENQPNFVDILYPLNGEHVQGNFNVYGNAGGATSAGTVTLRVNDRDVIISEVTWTGHYRFSLTPDYLEPGWNELIVHSNFGGDEPVLSMPRNLYYQPDGPWVTIDSLTMGDFAFERPWFTGRAGYFLNEDDQELLEDRKADKEQRSAVLAKTLDYIDISFDNGNTFVKTSGSRELDTDWRYRLETGEMAEGIHYILVRANMKNGEVAVTRTVVHVDKTNPVIRLIAPQPGGRYNQDLEFSAMASDDVALASLRYHLREGDKMWYEVPGFLQGLYFDVTIPPFIRLITNDAPVLFAGGASFMDAGFGLSFFDDNVKIQVQYGFLTQDLYEMLGGTGDLRYGGHMFGIKLLANVYSLPFGMLIGPDFEWLRAAVAIGANFTLFDLGSQGYTQSGDPTWMSALLLQLEFPKVTIPKQKYFRTFSFFTEGQLWFVPTDVNTTDYGVNVVIPHLIVGLRMYVF